MQKSAKYEKVIYFTTTYYHDLIFEKVVVFVIHYHYATAFNRNALH